MGENYHFLIAQCFAETNTVDGLLPTVRAKDDAAAAGWFTLEQVKDKCARKEASPGIDGVIERARELSAKGLLPTQRTE